MGDVVALIVMLAIVIGAIVYVVRAKKRGRSCIGCPHGSCGSKTPCDPSLCACCHRDEE